jgi:anti-sigma B factor antagonist
MWNGTEEEFGGVVILNGRVDASTVSALRDRVHRAVDRGDGRLVIDLTDIETIDVTGLNMLIGAQRRAQRAGRDLVLRGVPVRVSRLLRATRLSRVLREEPAESVTVG